jgi:GDPmannose 4,6-dehydratase
LAFDRAGISVEFRGSGIDEVGINLDNGQTIVAVDPRYFRPTEVDLLVGDASKARKELGWEPRVRLPELVAMMVDSDMTAARQSAPFVFEPDLTALDSVLQR